MGVLLLGDGELGDEGLIAIRFGICDTFRTVGAFGSVGALARSGAGGDVLINPPLVQLSSGILMI